MSQDQNKKPRESGAFFFRRRAAAEKSKSTSHFRTNLSIVLSIVALAVSGFSIYLQFFRDVDSLKFGVNHAAVDTKLKSLRILYYVANIGNRPAILSIVAGKVQGIPFQSKSGEQSMQPLTATTLLHNKSIVLKPGEIFVERANVCLADLFTVKNSVILNVEVIAFDSHGTYYDYHTDVLRTDFLPGWIGALNDRFASNPPPTAMVADTNVKVSPRDGGEIFQPSSAQSSMRNMEYLDMEGNPLSPVFAPIDLDPKCEHVLVRDKSGKSIH